ncbi:unnamed protein product [Rangifer tarandus platyrhynchus]|uniref:Uncharacterized protein n=1 Tax=Rangifer tarandus platyrhynchus TaxID=3082113 RepID=A0ABN8ZAI7_RANTA|nr:unnamed protein product [Rangifer tarandus platyrhynchus]CAI9689237.1 unnamed protein product [Rangifer tarandus platyrhynchus]
MRSSVTGCLRQMTAEASGRWVQPLPHMHVMEPGALEASVLPAQVRAPGEAACAAGARLGAPQNRGGKAFSHAVSFL